MGEHRIAGSRREGREQGIATYFTGEVCINGHVAVRDTISGTCAECQKLYSRRSQKRIRNKAKRRIEKVQAEEAA